MSDSQAERPLTFAEKIAKSSQVAWCSYDEAKQELSVVFRTTPAMYVYFGFPPDMWAQFQAAPSLGSFLIKNVTRKAAGASDPPFKYQKRDLPEGFVMPVYEPEPRRSAGKVAGSQKAPEGEIGF